MLQYVLSKHKIRNQTLYPGLVSSYSNESCEYLLDSQRVRAMVVKSKQRRD